MCAKPRAAPPPSTSPMRTGRRGSGAITVGAGDDLCKLPQPLTNIEKDPAKK
ncbi:MAG: hypothetical protein NVSMB6_00910 [Burkholderiaceae bacterium]